MEGIDAAYISKCLYHPEEAPLCPIFRLGDIVKMSGFNFETIAKMVSLLPQVERHVSIPLQQYSLLVTCCLCLRYNGALYLVCVVFPCPDREVPLVLWSTGRVT